MGTSLPNFVPGEPFDHSEVNRLHKAVRTMMPMRGGPGVRIRRQPWGWTARYSGGGGGAYSPATWRVTVSGAYPDTLQCTIGAGLVNGVAPVILDANGNPVPITGNPGATPAVPPPKLSVPKSAFDPVQGQSCLYLQATMNPAGGPLNVENWFLQQVVPVALPGLPPLTAYTAWKLLGFFLLQNGNVQFQQMAFFNLGVGTIFTRSTAGAARYVWYAAS